MSVQLADSHLTYIACHSLRGVRYDVYHCDRRGPQLGIVERDGHSSVWRATDAATGMVKAARTRWEAATALWGVGS